MLNGTLPLPLQVLRSLSSKTPASTALQGGHPTAGRAGQAIYLSRRSTTLPTFQPPASMPWAALLAFWNTSSAKSLRGTCSLHASTMQTCDPPACLPAALFLSKGLLVTAAAARSGTPPPCGAAAACSFRAQRALTQGLLARALCPASLLACSTACWMFAAACPWASASTYQVCSV